MKVRYVGPVLLALLLAGVAAGISRSERLQREALAKAERDSVVRQGDAEARLALARLTPPAPMASPLPPCQFRSPVSLPPSAKVLAGGSYSGRELAFQIDQSGTQARQVEVVVNSPQDPAALVLGAYGPTVWNIKWTPGTKVAAVVLSGYSRQVAAGLDKHVPVFISTYSEPKACGYFLPSEPERSNLDPMAKALFGKTVSKLYLDNTGTLIIGDAPAAGAPLLTSAAVTPESYLDPEMPLAGKAGLVAAVAKGLLKVPTSQEVAGMLDAFEKTRPARPYSPPVVGEDPLRDAGASPGLGLERYVVLKPFTYPSALHGAHAAVFFVPKGVKPPKGDPGHSTVFDLNTMTCAGPVGCPDGA